MEDIQHQHSQQLANHHEVGSSALSIINVQSVVSAPSGSLTNNQPYQLNY